MMFRKKKQEYNYLEMTPLRNYSHELREDGLINVLVPKFTDIIFSKILMPFISKPYIKANLDEFGSSIWLLLDGNQKVKDIADILTEKFGERIQPVHNRLTIFLTSLYQAGFISFKELKKE